MKKEHHFDELQVYALIIFQNQNITEVISSSLLQYFHIILLREPLLAFCHSLQLWSSFSPPCWLSSVSFLTTLKFMKLFNFFYSLTLQQILDSLKSYILHLSCSLHHCHYNTKKKKCNQKYFKDHLSLYRFSTAQKGLTHTKRLHSNTYTPKGPSRRQQQKNPLRKHPLKSHPQNQNPQVLGIDKSQIHIPYKICFWSHQYSVVFLQCI